MGRDRMATFAKSKKVKEFHREGQVIEINGFRYKPARIGNLALRWSDHHQDWIKTNRTNQELHDIMGKWTPFEDWWNRQALKTRRNFAVKSQVSFEMVNSAIRDGNREILAELESIINEDLTRTHYQTHRVENFGEEFS
jgi:hypothetical protein